ncbi:leukotriene B4 receptor 1-like isoform X3 [Myxocyprinus asiaticus]|uniref:leukotriene B4 receptor 1-like isoform X3 n=1 Tax=Myxocyprinus asiaticus TaxID=70543 RepID=UPI00222207DB|nr:leukotriene B4 receptor 1-like isoform X3 [Myxocyprinus asiaticus]
MEESGGSGTINIAETAWNHTDFLVSYPLLKIPPSSPPIALVPLSSPSQPLNMSINIPSNTSNGKASVDDTIISNSGGAVTGAVILGLVFFLGVPGNLFIVWSILARAHRRSITTLLILNLAYADGFIMLLTPFFIVYLVKRSWIFGLALCKILFYLCCANMYASIFLIMLMSLHRLVAIVWPKRPGALTERRMVMRALVVLWVLALGLSMPPLVFRTTAENPKEPQSLPCECKHSKRQYVASTLYPDLSPAKKRLDQIWTSYRALTSTVAFVSSCINPVLYTFAGKSYIRRNGLAFMARLFEGTGLESTRKIRRSNQNSRDREKEADEGESLKDKDSDSTTSVNANTGVKVAPQKNGKFHNMHFQ